MSDFKGQADGSVRQPPSVTGRAWSRWRLCLLSWAVVGPLCGCRDVTPRTEVMLFVDADPEVRELTTGLRFELHGYKPGSGTDASNSEDVLPQKFPQLEAMLGPWPHRFAIVPKHDDASRVYDVTLSALAGGRTIAVVRASSGFVARKTLALQLHFEASCLQEERSLSCESNETCHQGSCASAAVAPESLPLLSAQPQAAGSSGAAGAESIENGGRMGTTSSGINMGAAGGGAGSAGLGQAGDGMSAGSGADDECGDGRVSGAEACDPAIDADLAGACPSACPANDPCNPEHVEGSGCAQRCVATPIKRAQNDDSCCPQDANAESDNDCKPSCGNGKLEAGEHCDPIASCPNATTCKATDACLQASVTGNASECTAECKLTPISACQDHDNCCPAGCKAALDADCSASCGDRVIDATETCEAQTAQPCPANCDDRDACTTDVMTGSADTCNVVCTHAPIATASLVVDGCCPPGASANTDADCAAACGNGMIESGELCDGNCASSAADCADNMSCTADRVSGTLCTRQCVHSPITMPSLTSDSCCPSAGNANSDADCSPVCGNSVVESGERCDGNCPSTAADCTDSVACTLDRVTGTGCGRQCSHTPSVPTSTADGCCPAGGNANNDADCPVECGNKVKEPGESCDDGNLVDGDGCSGGCVPDDIISTPGDDRAGYIKCGDATCMPGMVCCAGSMQTCTLVCGSISYKCDGSEDCPSGQLCWVFDGAICTASGSVGGQRCHTSAECTAPATCSSGGNCG
jgi:cysteine-rich repeat protein